MSEPFVTLVTHVHHFVGPSAVKRLNGGAGPLACHDRAFADPGLRDAFEAEHPGAIACSATEPEDLISEVVDRFGHLDALVSNDPYPAERAPVEEASADQLRQAFEHLAVWPYRLIGAAARAMKASGQGGRIVLVTSAAPLTGIPNYTMYAAARGAANAMVGSLAKELAKAAVSVNAVAPNFIKNPDYFPPELLADEAALKKILSNIPLRRLGEPEEVAELIALLAGPKCGFVTGHVIPIAGGWA